MLGDDIVVEDRAGSCLAPRRADEMKDDSDDEQDSKVDDASTSPACLDIGPASSAPFQTSSG